MELEIISGGQTGVDQGALDAALQAQVPCGGWCPDGAYDENGPLDAKYPLDPMPDGHGYAERTRANVRRATATLIIYFGELEGGTQLTLQACFDERRRFKLIDAELVSPLEASNAVCEFVCRHAITCLNVAGPRASKQPAAHDFAYRCISSLLQRLDSCEA